MAIRRPPSLKVRALQWLAQREHSRAELREKLLRLAHAPPQNPGAGVGDGEAPDDAPATEPALEPEQEVDTLLAWLEVRGYLSDPRFLESRVATRAPRFGNLRIENELRQRGVELDADTRQSLRDTELQRAREVWQRKYGRQTPADPAARLRQMRFLAGRGFSAEVVRQVLRTGTSTDDE